MNPIELLAGMDIAHLKEEEVVHEAKGLISVASAGGGHFIGSSSEITPSTPLENIIAFYKAVSQHGRYPIKKFNA